MLELAMAEADTTAAKRIAEYLTKRCASWGAVGGDAGSGKAMFVPPGERGTIVLLHDYNSQKGSLVPWAYVLAQAGYRAILVDLPGHGQSSGPTVSFGRSEVAALTQALHSFQQQGLCGAKVGLLGLGYGANVALCWAAVDSRIGAVVAIAPYNQPDEALGRMAEEAGARIPRELLQGALARAAERVQIRWADWSGEAALRQLKQPVLLIGSGQDRVSVTNDLRLLERAAPFGSRSLLVPEASHFTVQHWFHETAEPVKSWFRRHLDPPGHY